MSVCVCVCVCTYICVYIYIYIYIYCMYVCVNNILLRQWYVYIYPLIISSIYLGNLKIKTPWRDQDFCMSPKENTLHMRDEHCHGTGSAAVWQSWCGLQLSPRLLADSSTLVHESVNCKILVGICRSAAALLPVPAAPRADQGCRYYALAYQGCKYYESHANVAFNVQ